MSSLRRIVAAGLPTVGVTVLTTLALAGTPAQASPGEVGARPVVMSTPCAAADRATCGYGATGPTGNGTGSGPVRGHGGYGTTGPSTTPAASPSTTPSGSATPTPGSPTPTGNTDTVPPGVSPSSAAPA